MEGTGTVTSAYLSGATRTDLVCNVIKFGISLKVG
jgi:hypothetical protein